MFRQIAKSLPRPEDLFTFHPLQLAGALEQAWSRKFSPAVSPSPELAKPLPTPLLNLAQGIASTPQSQVVSDHLIYAYMIENTRIYEIFHRVLREYLHGERLDIPSSAGQQWVRTTEELFYRDPPSFFIFSLTSYVRPDLRASRRNAYYRMFGLDLNHGTDDGRPYPYEKATIVNRDFVPTFEKFLFEVWRGIINVNTTSGPNPTDDAAIRDHVANLFDMLTNRRRNGNLSREEFFFVSLMSWFHLTVEFDSPIVVDLKAQGSSPAERLKKIGERVGLPAHGRAEDLFSLADPASTTLLAIESGLFKDISQVGNFYRNPVLPATTNPLRDDIKTIITNWSTATGRNVKGEPVTASPAATSPAAVPTAAVSPNGGSPVPVPRT
jgi:hypothetical protein